VIQDKLEFREEYGQRASVTQLNYILKVLKILFKNKASVADPEGFRDKVRLYEKANVIKQPNELKRQKSNVSAFSKSNKSGTTQSNDMDNDTVDEDDDQDTAEKKQLKVKNAPVMQNLNSLFTEVQT